MSAVIRVSLMVVTFGLLFGFSTASIAGVLDRVIAALSLRTQQAEILVATLVVGCFVGAAAAGVLSARLGRRKSLAISVALAAPGFAVMVLTQGYFPLLLARFLVGLAVGLSSMVVPMYAAEVTPSRYRGAVVSLFQLAVTAGIMLAYGIAFVFMDAPWPLILGSGILIVLGCGGALLLLPESPRWLLSRGQGAAARHAAENLGVADELTAAEGTAETARFDWRVVRKGSTAAVLVLCAALFVLQNLSGIDGILYYAPTIFTELGFSAGTAALAATFGLGIANFGATLVALRYVDRAGRRPLLIGGSVAMAVGLGTTVVAALLDLPWLGLGALVVYIVAFAVSLGPLPYVLMSELFPTAIREQGIATASATSWLFNGLVAVTFLSLVNSAGLVGAMGLFAAVCVVSVLVSIFLVPETRGVPLEAIEDKVLRGERLRHLGL
ncbi:MAG: sugar porter family MFS transporter [Rhizobiales bacterium]|nr:sugar porter family MFS transporter [Hyphomicrobiales bacterium]